MACVFCYAEYAKDDTVNTGYTSTMFFSVFIRHYLWWHYRDALASYIRIYKNFFWFLVSFFSLGELSRSFFAPYKRITEPRGRGFSIEAWFNSLIINTMSRGIGMIVRGVILLVGFITLMLHMSMAIIGYAVWIGAPLIIIGSIVLGVTLVI